METISESTSTEQKIKAAAMNVFIKKGFAATKTRDIAEEAKINIASLHYYFRSKDKLFQLVIGDAMKKFSSGMDEVFESDMPLHQKIKAFTHRYIDFFKENPHIPIFIISESQLNAERVKQLLAAQKGIEKLKNQLNDLAEKGVIRSTHPAQFILNIVSLTAFPFLSRPLLMKKIDLNDTEYDELLEERKTMIPELIINYMYLKKPD